MEFIQILGLQLTIIFIFWLIIELFFQLIKKTTGRFLIILREKNSVIND